MCACRCAAVFCEPLPCCLPPSSGQVRRNYGRQSSNELRGARGSSAHACSTGLSTGRRLMPMTARCGAATPFRRATTVRQLQHTRRVRGSCWLCGAHRTRAAAAACETEQACCAFSVLSCVRVCRLRGQCFCTVVGAAQVNALLAHACLGLDCHEFSSAPASRASPPPETHAGTPRERDREISREREHKICPRCGCVCVYVFVCMCVCASVCVCVCVCVLCVHVFVTAVE